VSGLRGRWELDGPDGEDLHVDGDRLAKREAVDVHAQTRPHAAHLGVGLVAELERHSIVPDEPEDLVAIPLQRLVMAQDTGSAIVGAVRADYFWGWGDGAEAAAGRMKQPLRMWVLWPRG